MKAEEIREFLKYYDDGILTESELQIRIHEKMMDQYLDHMEEHGKPTGHFSAGAFVGPFKHKYCLIDTTSHTTVFYPFTLRYVIRMYWNKLMRRLDWTRWVKVW